MNIRISGIVQESIVDGPGIRYVIFTQGCIHNCTGCHNTGTHSIDGGSVMTCAEIADKFKRNTLLEGITLSGGEPFLQAKQCAILAGEAHDAGLSVFVYTGYTFDELYKRGFIDGDEDIKCLLKNTDILVDGRFVLEERNILLKFRGSENQRIIDVAKTLATYEDTKQIAEYVFEEY